MNKHLHVLFDNISNIEHFDFRNILNVSDFFLALQVGSPALFQLGDYKQNIYLAEIVPNNDFDLFTVKLKKGMKFSDGTELTARDLAFTLNRLIEKSSGVHFDAAIEVSSINLEGPYKLTIKLNKSNSNFPLLLGKPESSILPQGTINIKDSLLKRSSGPFFVDSFSKEKISFVKNRNFPGFIGNIESLSWEVFSEERQLERADVFFPGSNIVQPQGMDSFPLFSQTCYLSFNHKNRSSVWIKEKHLRVQLWEKLKTFDYSEPFEKRTSFYTEQKDTISNEPLIKHQTHNEIKLESTPIRVLTPTNSMTNHLLQKIRLIVPNANVTTVETLDDMYFDCTVDHDLKLVWNDFDGSDPYLAFYNSLNPKRPLIDSPKNLRKTYLECPHKVSQNLFTQLDKEILDEAFNLPVFKRHFSYFTKPNITHNCHVPEGFWEYSK